MARLIILGATGSLGRHVLDQALLAGHRVTVLVRSPSRLPLEILPHVSLQHVDLATIGPAELSGILAGNEALIDCAGHVSDGEGFVELFDRVVTAIEMLGSPRPVCWFLAGAALLDIDSAGRRGVDLPKVSSTYWPHRRNFERLVRARFDWRLLCPGPMVDQPSLGHARLRISLDTLPVQVPAIARTLPAPLLVPLFASLIPQMIVPYPDAAAVMLGDIDPGSPTTRRRVGLALPVGMRGHKPRSQGVPRRAEA